MEKDSNSTPLTPCLVLPGLATEEGQKKATEAMERRGTADYKSYLLLRQLMEEGFVITHEDKEVLDSFLEEAQEVIKDRKQAGHDFLEAVAGR